MRAKEAISEVYKRHRLPCSQNVKSEEIRAAKKPYILRRGADLDPEMKQQSANLNAIRHADIANGLRRSRRIAAQGDGGTHSASTLRLLSHSPIPGVQGVDDRAGVPLARTRQRTVAREGAAPIPTASDGFAAIPRLIRAPRTTSSSAP